MITAEKLGKLTFAALLGLAAGVFAWVILHLLEKAGN